ncbi:hypothetical protein V1478_017060 [Vespula squamosa]|uniref:Uncharacterized protein n=1 Tax=Vespula squamosa TaxID=30214 RepID=A0ABD1ZYV4_VESSQ
MTDTCLDKVEKTKKKYLGWRWGRCLEGYKKRKLDSSVYVIYYIQCLEQWPPDRNYWLDSQHTRNSRVVVVRSDVSDMPEAEALKFYRLGVNIVFQMILEISQHDIPAQISMLSTKNRPHRSLYL